MIEVTFLVAACAAQYALLIKLDHILAGDLVMDEKFHIPQAQAYCSGQFGHYDDKLTTPPGLYLLSFALNKLGLPCSTFALRFQNMVLGTVCLPLILAWAARLRPQICNSRSVIIVSVSPIFSFFCLFYYTDILGTILVLLTYGFAISHRSHKAALTGFLSLWVRQTNFVWLAALALIDVAQGAAKTFCPQKQALSDPAAKSKIISIASATLALPQIFLNHPRDLFRRCSPYAVPFAFALGFLLWNKSIVLGHQEFHEAGLYPVQLGYVSAFCVALSWPSTLWQLWSSQSTFRAVHGLQVASLVMLFAAALKYTDRTHPFVLADNRHIVFYVHRYILSRWPRIVLASIYGASTWVTLMLLVQTATPIECAGILTAGALTLVPTSLLEPRYYIVFFAIWRQYMKPVPRWVTALELCLWTLLHVAIMSIFIHRPFGWPGTPGLQRIMW
ncbi:glucosyltransferase [Savitreella phatthalungensis]